MLYLVISLAIITVAIFILIWLRKMQYDAIHRNFLDLIDRFGGKVVRGGFAIRPKYMGTVEGHQVSVSISSERKHKDQSRKFYISIYSQARSLVNFTILSNEWLNMDGGETLKGRFIKLIADKSYLLEVTEKKTFNKLNFAKIEETIRGMHPFAYALISKNGLILERLSENLVRDTEYEHLKPLMEGMTTLSSSQVMKTGR